MFSKAKTVTNVIAGTLVVMLVAFALAFSFLLYNAFSLAESPIGLAMSFTGYEYIAIEASFAILMISGGAYVFNNALRRPMIEIEIEEA